jgi:hypothetical protein
LLRLFELLPIETKRKLKFEVREMTRAGQGNTAQGTA